MLAGIPNFVAGEFEDCLAPIWRAATIWIKKLSLIVVGAIWEGIRGRARVARHWYLL
jgi:hypothetical protein